MLYDAKGIQWRWVLVGTLIVLGLQSLLTALIALMGMDVASLGVIVAITTASFLFGGGLIGWMSPGYTPWEGGFASGAAAVGSVVVATQLYAAAQGIVVLLPLAGLWGMLCGLGGGKLGEMIQGSS